MSLVTSCPACGTMFRVVPDQLKISEGWVRCGHCAEVFDATERMRVPGPNGTIAHSEIEIVDSVVMVDDASPAMGTKAPPTGGLDGSPTSLYVYVPDVDSTVERAVKLGAILVRAPEEQFYGDRNAFIVDPFGHGWTVATHVEDVAPEEMMRRMNDLFGDA